MIDGNGIGEGLGTIIFQLLQAVIINACQGLCIEEMIGGTFTKIGGNMAYIGVRLVIGGAFDGIRSAARCSTRRPAKAIAVIGWRAVKGMNGYAE